jgi:hypothetical protein
LPLKATKDAQRKLSVQDGLLFVRQRILRVILFKASLVLKEFKEPKYLIVDWG